MLHGSLSTIWAPHHGWALAGLILGALGIGALMLGLLASVPGRYRKLVVAAVTFLAGLYFSLEFLLPHQPGAGAGIFRILCSAFANWLTDIKPFVGISAQIIGSFALLLGVLNLFQIHGKAVTKRTPGWYNSAAFFIAFFAIMICGFLMDMHKSRLAAPLFGILFKGFLTSLDSTMFSLIAFYIVSAAYRAFRIRSAEAVLMMVTAAIIMLGLVPVGVYLTSWIPDKGILSAFRLENIMYWLLTGPNMAAQRAIAFGVAVGGLAMGLRIWLSLERGSFFDRQL